MASVGIDGEAERDEWGDDDFEIPYGHPLIAPNAQSHAAAADDGDDDWDIEMSLGKAGGMNLPPGVVRGFIPSIASQMGTTGFVGTVTRLGAGGKPVESDWNDFAAPALSDSPNEVKSHIPSITPGPQQGTLDKDLDWDVAEEGTATIKLPIGQPILMTEFPASLPSTSDFTPTTNAPHTLLEAPTPLPKLPRPAPELEEDFEADFDLPVDLSQLSLRPLHQSTSRGTAGSPGDPWTDYASMSTTTYSSETSSLGFGHHASPSTSAWSGGTETDEDDYAFLDGLVVPDGMFDKENKANLTRILDVKKKTPTISKPKHDLNPGERPLYVLVLDLTLDSLRRERRFPRWARPRRLRRPLSFKAEQTSHSFSCNPSSSQLAISLRRPFTRLVPRESAASISYECT
jgi:hypothetical protein